MKSGFLIFIGISIGYFLCGQSYSLNTDDIIFIVGGDTIDQPMTGGFNQPDPRFIDWDNDGWDDIFLNDRDGRLQYWRRTPDTNTPHYRLLSKSFQNLIVGNWFVFNDFDGDNDKDLLCHAIATSGVSYYENINGVFTMITEQLIDDDGNPVDGGQVVIPTIANINNDQFVDYFIGDVGGHVAYYKGTGFDNSGPHFRLETIHFEDIEIVWTPNRHGANAIEFFDLDNDGDLDLLWGDFYQPGMFYLENFGNPSEPDFNHELMVEDFLETAGGITAGYNIPRISDVDDDGDGDLIVGVISGAYGQDFINNLLFFRNTGTVTNWSFELETRHYLPGLDFIAQSHPTFIDIDDDGDDDLFVGTKFNQENPGWSGQIYFFRNIMSNENPVFSLEDSAYFGRELGSALAPVFVDLDNDNDFDAYIGEFNGGIIHYDNVGSANMAEWQESDPFLGLDLVGNATPAFGDLDNDGDIDFACGDKIGNLFIYVNDEQASEPQFTLYRSLDVGNYSSPTIYGGKVIIGTESGSIYQWSIDNPDSVILLDMPFTGKYATPTIFQMEIDAFNAVIGTAGGGLIHLVHNDTLNTHGSFKYLSMPSLIPYPNPANPHLTISINVPNENIYKISLINLNGREVEEVWNGYLSDGYHKFVTRRKLASGIYIIYCNSEQHTISSKVTVIK